MADSQMLPVEPEPQPQLEPNPVVSQAPQAHTEAEPASAPRAARHEPVQRSDGGRSHGSSLAQAQQEPRDGVIGSLKDGVLDTQPGVTLVEIVKPRCCARSAERCGVVRTLGRFDTAIGAKHGSPAVSKTDIRVPVCRPRESGVVGDVRHGLVSPRWCESSVSHVGR